MSLPLALPATRSRRPVVVAAALALSAAVAWVAMPADPPIAGPNVRLYLTTERQDPSATARLRTGDAVVATVRTEPGAYVSFLAMGGNGRLDLGRSVDVPVDAGEAIIRRFVAEGEPGLEQLIVLAARAPLPALPHLVEQANASPDQDRTARLNCLRAGVAATLPRGSWTLHVGPELVHTAP